MRNLFVSYYIILRKHGIGWLLEKTQKIAVHNALVVILVTIVQYIYNKDLIQIFNMQIMNEKRLMDHSIKLAEASELVDNGKPRRSKEVDKDRSRNKNSGQKTETKKKKSNNESNKNETPIYLNAMRKYNGLRHYMCH